MLIILLLISLALSQYIVKHLSNHLAIENVTSLIVAIFLSTVSINAQTVIRMEPIRGVYAMPCEVNGLSLRFILDTGASNVSISLTEALFMVKNGYLAEEDLRGTQYYQLANGDITEGTEILLREITIGKLKLYNIKASIVHDLSAPLLLGQSALRKLGKIEFDYATNTLTIKKGPKDYTDSQSNTYHQTDHEYARYHKFKTTFDKPPFDLPLRDQPGLAGRELYKCPQNATIYVIDNSGEEYFKVYVDGYTGYLRNYWLKRKR
jgi:clan AA aspartic protease (TIGR02281 family)